MSFQNSDEDRQQTVEIYRCGHHYVVSVSVCNMHYAFEVRHDALPDMKNIWIMWSLEEAKELVHQLQAIDKREHT